MTDGRKKDIGDEVGEYGQYGGYLDPGEYGGYLDPGEFDGYRDPHEFGEYGEYGEHDAGPEELEYLGTVDAVGRLLEEEFGPGRTWPWTWARRIDVAECIIDAVFSIRARAVDVDRIIDRWRCWRVESGVEVRTTRDLALALRTMPGLTTPCDEGGFPSAVAVDARPVFPRNRIAGRLKTEVVEEAATVLDDAGIVELVDLCRTLALRPMSLRNEWLRVHGLGETSFCHLRLLAGSDALDPGVRVLRFLGVGKAVRPRWAKDVILGVADSMEVPPVAVEYALSLLAARSHVTKRGGHEPSAA